MYEQLNCFEEALKHFGTRVEIICALELSKKISPEDAYHQIKNELKDVKKCRKLWKQGYDPCPDYDDIEETTGEVIIHN